jgi:hypothetical protein
MKWLMVDVESIVIELSRMPLPSPPRQLVIAGAIEESPGIACITARAR